MAYFFHANQENVLGSLAGLFVLLTYVCKSVLGDCALYSDMLHDKIFEMPNKKSRFTGASFLVAEEEIDED